jgi:hypothetical protein
MKASIVPDLPLDWLSVPEKAAGGTVVRQCGKPDCGICSLVRGSRCALSAHACPHPARTHGIHLDRGRKLFRQPDGERVQGCSRHAVEAGATRAFGG